MPQRSSARTRRSRSAWSVALLIWPAGVPRPAKNGRDPGGHNRDAQTWDEQSGHYGHCHVPENTHWDPGYSESELAFIMNASFDAQGALVSPAPVAASHKPPAKARRSRTPVREPRSTMPDHGVVSTDAAAPRSKRRAKDNDEDA
jgi:hypothetical protein